MRGRIDQTMTSQATRMPRLVVLAALTATCLAGALLPTQAHATPSGFGQLASYGGVGKVGTGPGKFTMGAAHAFGADPLTGDVYVGDEPAPGSDRIQDFKLLNEGNAEEPGATKRFGTKEGAGMEGFAVDTERGVGDFSTAVDFVLRRRGLERVHVFAMSWGGTLAGAFAARNPDKVTKLALLAPQWVSDQPIPLDMGGHLNSYRLVGVRESISRWLVVAPGSRREGLIPSGWFELWAAATLAEDPWSLDKAPGKLRATNGPIQDIRDYWSVGKPFYDPSKISAPVLLLHGEWDRDVPLRLAQDYFLQLTGARYRRWVEIGEATHMLLLEKNRLQAFMSVKDFFLEKCISE